MSRLTYEFILIRYGELALKGKNRNIFEQQLAENIKQQLKGHDIKIKRTFGRMYLYLAGEDFQEVSSKLQRVFGISSYSPAIKAELDVDRIKEACLESILAMKPAPQTFKISVRRVNKSFPYSSQEMNHILGGHILRNLDGKIKVDVHHPDTEITVEIREEAAYIMSARFPGAGGLPVGSSGKAMLLLSGGIDSPVAGYLALKRGLRIEAVHFHSYPFTSERAQQKVIDLCKKLSQYAGSIRLHMVPFTTIQTQIRQHIPEEYSITIMRRFMLRIAERLAEKHKALALVTGDSLGQVASQTLESMHTINEVTNLPILRPLVTMDKQEIIQIAQEIDTYPISILPYEDCCTIFQPKSPKTKPTRERANSLESRLNLTELIEEAVEKTEMYRYSAHEEKEDQLDSLF